MNPKQILIVDDEIAILDVLRSSIKKLGAGYQVETVTDGYQALEKLHQQKFDLFSFTNDDFFYIFNSL